MSQLPNNSVALVVTSPPYFVGKEYELAVTSGSDSAVPETYIEYLTLLGDVFSECVRVLEPGGRIAVNVANLGRKPYRSLAADVIAILQDQLGLLLRGEIIWQKAKASGGSCAWGSFAKASNPVLRDNTERVIVASKGSFARAITAKDRAKQGLPHQSTITNDEFVDVTKDVWEIDAESATRVGHPAPFPVELPRRLIDLYTYEGDLVLDPFLGSGSTVVAAARTGRIGVGYDTDPRYVELATNRLGDEIDRLARLDAVPLTDLNADERQDVFTTAAVDQHRKAQDIAHGTLSAAGFTFLKRPRSPAAKLDFDFFVTSPNGDSFWVDVAGAFTTSRPGLQRAEAVWALLGRLHVLRTIDPEARVIVLTPNLPKAASAHGKALAAIEATGQFRTFEILDPATPEALGA